MNSQKSDKEVSEKENEKGYRCCNCNKLILFSKDIGTKHRNHCAFCLRSQHLDDKKSGDRKSKCKGCMQPIGLTFKQEGKDKYNKLKQGELMIIHKCISCGKISINRIASDDNSNAILKVFEESKKLNSIERKQLQEKEIYLLTNQDKEKILIQLFGLPVA
ncbi:MAG: RNHCP domain-containing protein [Patescibacteria group bacterium]|nr:RNHCP domain-containing protein [Patescibacteria group bacterium]